MSKFPVLDINGKQKENIDLPDTIFGKTIKRDIIHQAVLKYQASLRQGNASTKERAYVSGGGKKPYRQKGTGRARAGSSRSPLWIHGGTTFGPHPRDFSYTVPKKIKRIALKESLNAKFKNKSLYCIVDIKESLSKTKDFAKLLKNLNIKGKVLGVLDGSDLSVSRVSRNIPYFNLMRSQDVNSYDVMRYKNLLLTKTALANLLDRLNK